MGFVMFLCSFFSLLCHFQPALFSNSAPSGSVFYFLISSFLSECENIFLICFFRILFACLLLLFFFFFFATFNVLFFLSHFAFYWNNISYLILFIDGSFESNYMFDFFLHFFFNFTVIEHTLSCLLLKSEYLRNECWLERKDCFRQEAGNWRW